MRVVRLSLLLIAFAMGSMAFWFEAPVAAETSAQNANSATTAMPGNTNANAGTSRGRRSRRGRRPAAAATMETMPAESQTMATAATEQTDLSGTYAGTFDCSDVGLTGETTLTITGNQFTLADGRTGRIVGSTTRGYTAVALQMGESVATSGAQPGTVPTIVSMRAKKSGDRLTLLSVPGSGRVCSFTPAVATRSRRTRARAAMPAQATTPAEMPAAATTAEPAMPATSAGPMPPAPATRGRRGRRGTPANANSNANMNMNMNKSTNDNTGEGNPNPKATPTPPVPRN
jgi:hypothetical protein